MGFVLDCVTNSEPIVRYAFWLGLATLCVTLLMAVFLFLMRLHFFYQAARKRQFLATWRPLFVQCLSGVSAPRYPLIRTADTKNFLVVWNHFQQSLRGEAKEYLNQLLYDTAIDVRLYKWLRHRSITKRLLAMMTLGHLRNQVAWQPLLTQLYDANPYLSVAAASALIKIDADAAMALVMPLLVARHDWPNTKIIMFLKEAGSSAFSTPLANAIRTSLPQPKGRLIDLLELLPAELSAQLVREIIQTEQSPQTIARCLRVLKDPHDLDLVRRYSEHPDLAVRVQVASALGRIGLEEDRERLMVLLVDAQWWVRYRAAQALSALPSMSVDELLHIQQQHTDHLAKEMIAYVLAESAL